MNELLLDTVQCADALDFLRGLPDASVDMALTSPPYNLRNSTGGGFSGSKNDLNFFRNAQLTKGYDGYSDDMSHEDYICWQREVMTEMFRIIPDNGAIFYNHKWRVQGGLWQRLGDEITASFPVRQIIIWYRGGGMNFNDGYFLPTYEVIYLIAKSNFKLIPQANGYGNVWKIAKETNSPHPAPFPYELPRRCISSTDGQIICDPFGGSGTTAMAARDLGRHYLTCDISEEYCDLMRRRLDMPFTPRLFE